MAQGDAPPTREWPCLAPTDKVAHQDTGVTPSTPWDLVFSLSVWEAVGKCLSYSPVPSQCPPTCTWGEGHHLESLQSKRQAIVLHPSGPWDPRECHPGVLPALEPLDGCFWWEWKPPCITCGRHHKYFLIKCQ